MPELFESATGNLAKQLTRKTGLAARVLAYHATQFRGKAIRQAWRGAQATDRALRGAEPGDLPGLARALDLYVRLQADILQMPLGSGRARQTGHVIQLADITQDGPEIAQPVDVQPTNANGT